MSAPPPIPPDLLDCVQRLAVVLRARTEVLNAIIASMVKSVPGLEPEREIPAAVERVLPLMLQALGSSSHTLVQLSDAPGLQTRDCYSIVRSVVELAVNICFIIARGEDAANRALRHTRQKAYRDLERRSRIGISEIGVSFLGRPDVSEIDGLDQDLAEFSFKSGQEKPLWIDDSIDRRIEIVGEELGEPALSDLHHARFMIYRHSSEVLHGTHFGVHHCFGLTVPRERNDPFRYMGDNHMVILLASNSAISAVANAFHTRFGFSPGEKMSRDLWTATREIPYFADGLATEAGQPPETSNESE